MEIEIIENPSFKVVLTYQEAKYFIKRCDEPDLKEIFHNHSWSVLGELVDKLRRVVK